MKIRIFFFFYFCFLGACMTPATSVSESTLKKTMSLQEELRNIAVCYEEAVYLLQHEPEKMERVYFFLLDAKNKKDETSSPVKGDFSQLQWGPNQEVLRTLSGEQVHCRIVNQIQYLTEEGCHWQTTYRFSVPNRQEFSESTVDMMFPW